MHLYQFGVGARVPAGVYVYVRVCEYDHQFECAYTTIKERYLTHPRRVGGDIEYRERGKNPKHAREKTRLFGKWLP